MLMHSERGYFCMRDEEVRAAAEEQGAVTSRARNARTDYWPCRQSDRRSGPPSQMVIIPEGGAINRCDAAGQRQRSIAASSGDCPKMPCRAWGALHFSVRVEDCPARLYPKTGQAAGRPRMRSCGYGPEVRPNSRPEAEIGVIYRAERIYGDLRGVSRRDGERGVPQKIVKIERS